MTKRYLGDGVYAEYGKSREIIIITAEDGIKVTNKIYMEQEVWIAFASFCRSAFQGNIKDD